MQDLLQRSLRVEMGKLEALGYLFSEPPQILLDLRGTAAGQALLQRNCVRLNLSMLECEGATFARETLAHELCHLVVWQRWGAKARPHGRQWQELMRNLGYRAERCHQADAVPTRRQRRFPYRCPCRTHELSTTRHKRAQRGSRYVCRSCSGVLIACL